MKKFKSVELLVKQLKPNNPVYCIRKQPIHKSSAFFKKNFPGNILYAVKTNPNSEVLKTIMDTGINHFDVASVKEIETITKLNKNVKCSYMHTVKSRENIKEAYFKFGIKTFALDTKDELMKIIETTNYPKDLDLFVRVSVSNEHAEIDLSKKFGAPVSEAIGLLRLSKQYSRKVGISFHVGSQCMHPISYSKGITEIGKVIKKAKIIPDYINVGGGFPTIYPDLIPQSLDNYFHEIVTWAIEEYTQHLAVKVPLLDRRKNEVIEINPVTSNGGGAVTDQGYQMQKTLPGDGYTWHSDFEVNQNNGIRHLTFIFYLNTVDEGWTQFYNGDQVAPERGRVVIFPATWNYVHQGYPPKQNKYIVTGWVFESIQNII